MIGRQVNIQGLYLNPFTGYARISGFQLMESNDQDSFVAFDTLSIDMSLFRLLAKEIKINHIHLVNPNISIQQNGSTFNFDDLLALGVTDSVPANTPASDTIKQQSDNMAIALYNINIRGGHILYQDQERHSVWQMENFGLQIPGVYFSGQSTDVGIALNFNDGGHLETSIQYDMQAGNYILDVQLSNFSIAPIHPYLTDFININAIQGLFSTHLNIEGNADHITEFSLKGNMNLQSLMLLDTDEQPLFSSDSILVEIENINPASAVYHFNTIAINGIKTTYDLYPNANTLTRLLKTPDKDTLSALSSATTAEPTDTITPDFKIEKLRLTNSLFTFNDHTLHIPFHFTLENINMETDHLTLDDKNKIKIKSTLSNGGTIALNWEGRMDNMKNTDLLLSIKNLDLTAFTPYSLQYFGYPMKKGILSFNSINAIKNNLLDGRNNLNIAKCEVAGKQKQPKPEYNIPLKTALYLIKDVNDQIKIDLPVQGDITSPQFSYKKIIFKTLTNLLVKVAVSPVNFLANSLGLSGDKLKGIPFEAVQNDFTPEQLTLINQLSEMIKTKPDMTLTLEQYVNLAESKALLASFYVKKEYYLSLHPEKSNETLLPIDYTHIRDIQIHDEQFIAYVNASVSEEESMSPFETKIQSLVDEPQMAHLITYLINRRNQVLKEYLLRQQVSEKCIRITTATNEKLKDYNGKNEYKINMIFEGDEPDPELTASDAEEV